MGTLTFTELQDEVRSALGGRTDLNARLPRALNIAQQRLARIHDFDEMETLTTTTFGFAGTIKLRFGLWLMRLTLRGFAGVSGLLTYQLLAEHLSSCRRMIY